MQMYLIRGGFIMKIFEKIKYFSYEEKEALQLEFHNLLDEEMRIHKVNKKGLAAILSMSHDAVYNSFKISTKHFDKKIFAEILKKLQKKTSFRNLRKLRDLYPKVYCDEDNYTLQVMFDQIDNYEAGYLKQKPSFALGKIKFYVDSIIPVISDLEKAGF